MFEGSMFVEVCRLCLSKNKVNVLIFEDSIEKNNILTKIHSCLPIKITEEDELPKKICDECSFKVETFFQFRKKSLFSEQKLLTSLVNNNFAFIEEEKGYDSSDPDEDFSIEVEIKEEMDDIDCIPNEESPSTETNSKKSKKKKDSTTLGKRPKSNRKSDTSITNAEEKQQETNETPKQKKTPAKKTSPKKAKIEKPKITTPCSGTQESSRLCDICGKTLSSKEKLRNHRFIHTGYKPHSCKICSKRFLQHEELKKHSRVHTGERPYICRFCGKGFTQNSSLRIHERTHTGEKPYVCIICSRGFISKAAMDMHMKRCNGSSI